MPIKHETTNDSYQPGRGFPRLGKLRPGDTKVSKTGVTYPVDLDYFRVTFEPQYQHLAEPFRQLYGDQPKEFQPVYVIGKTADEAFPNWMESYNKSATLLRRCDSETMTKWLDEPTGRHILSPMPCLCAKLRADYDRQIAGLTDVQAAKVPKPVTCSRVGRLNLLFPALMDATGVMGYLTAETGSRSNIQTIYQVLMDMERLLGTLQGVPFIFGRAPVEINVNIDGQRKKVTKALFYLRATESFTQQHIIRQLSGFNAPALPEPTGQQLLPAPAPESIIVPSTGNGNGYEPVHQVEVDFDADAGVLTYLFGATDGETITFTSDVSLFLTAKISGAKIWEPGWAVHFNPPLMVKTRDSGYDEEVVAIQEYHGNIEVERPGNPFGGKS